MSGRQRIEQAAKENGWVMRPISVQTKAQKILHELLGAIR